MTEELSFGLELMFVGMGIVFVFLAMLVVAIHVMSALVQRFFPEAPIAPSSKPVLSATSLDKSVVAAITAAVHQHRNKHK
jgi:oxaloacetate decarboxylase (Na+ extruding) subunit gamma